MTDTRDDHGKGNALAWFQSIVDMVDAMRATMPAYDGVGAEPAHEEAIQHIQESVLSVEVRSGWELPDALVEINWKPAEYRILLSTGGPAAQISGDLDQYGQPENARLEYQDWFTPWTELHLGDLAVLTAPGTIWSTVEGMDKARDYLLAFAQQFYFGEG